MPLDWHSPISTGTLPDWAGWPGTESVGPGGPTAEASAHNAVRILAEKAQAKFAAEGASIRDLCSEVAIPLLQLADNTLAESDAKKLSFDRRVRRAQRDGEAGRASIVCASSMTCSMRSS